MKVISFVALVLVFSSCSAERFSRKEKIADKITAEVAKEIKEETGLSLIGTGGGMMRQIHTLSMSFQCYNPLTIEQARELLIYCSEKYLNKINSSEQIRPYLQNYPFKAKDIGVGIFIYESDKHPVLAGNLSLATVFNGNLAYKVNPSDWEPLKTIHKETYEQALRILSERHPFKNISKYNLKSLPRTYLEDASRRERKLSVVQQDKGE